MANKIFYQEDCNLSLLDGKKIAIIWKLRINRFWSAFQMELL